LNHPFHQLPSDCDVLVVGAGPAGSAAANLLARAGLDVVLVDQHAFPRDKVCGDGLLPDAHHALRRLGVLAEVMAAAQRATHVACVAPRGGRMNVPSTFAVLPRRQLDDIVCRAAVSAGARMFAPVRFVAPLEEERDGVIHVTGARLQCGSETRELRAPWVLLATGAVPQALQAAGMCDRRTPTSMALRGYVSNHSMDGRIASLEVVWHRQLRHGYGWIFPCGNGVFNIGVGLTQSHVPQRHGRHAMRNVNLRDMMDTFTRVHAPAAELLKGGQWAGELKGAPLRCSLNGARHSRPGLLVAGEAAGSTYDFTGEGIGKALQTGMLAAEALLQGRHQACSDAQVRAAYEQSLRALKPRYDIYRKAAAVNAHPWLVDLVVWNARRSPSRVQRLSGVLEETHSPGSLTNPKTWVRLLFERS
jgi:geranylgeranyl reductase family protein